MPFWLGRRDCRDNFFSYLPTVIKISLIQTFLLYTFFYLGISRVPASVTAIVVGSQPLVIAMVAHFLLHDDKLSALKGSFLFLGVIGIALLGFAKNPAYGQSVDPVGFGFLLLGCLCSAWGNIFVSRQKTIPNPLFLTSAQIFIGGFLLLILSFIIEGTPRPDYPGVFFVSLVWLAFLSAAAFSIWFYLLSKRKYKVSSLNVWKFIIPLNGALLSWTLLSNDSPSALSFAGMVLIVVSIFLYYKIADK